MAEPGDGENAVVFTVADVERTVGKIDVVGALQIVEDGGDQASFQVDRADGMAFGVGQVEDAGGVESETFWAGEFGFASGAVVARVTLFTGAGDVVGRTIGGIDAIDGVAFAEGDVEVA